MSSFPTPSSTSALESTGSGRAPGEVYARRELFWHNVIREILTALSVMSVKRATDVYDPNVEHAVGETFDGRLAVITSIGQRIPIKEVHPMFACSINGSEAQRQLSMDVQCSVFQIRTPGGEVHTLPIHEIRTFHALTPELMAQIEAQARAQQGGGSDQPFGFAAFTSMASSSEGESTQDLPGRAPPETVPPEPEQPGPVPPEPEQAGEGYTAGRVTGPGFERDGFEQAGLDQGGVDPDGGSGEGSRGPAQ